MLVLAESVGLPGRVLSPDFTFGLAGFTVVFADEPVVADGAIFAPLVD
jgi:hypothetical protein